VEPFVRFSQQWDRSTDPLRNFADRRVLVGARITAAARNQRPVVGDRRRTPSDITDDTSLNDLGRLGPRDPRYDALAKIDSSYAHIKAGRWPEAIAAARAALVLDPANAIAWANLGVALYKLGNVDEARQALERSLTLNPNNDALRSLLDQMPR
jgi:tetratricopeptide (TPR) repeat protein